MDEDEGFPGFYVPVDKKGANILVTINSKEPFGEPDDMKFWWRIFYCAKEDLFNYLCFKQLLYYEIEKHGGFRVGS